jgi:hypothetical protein
MRKGQKVPDEVKAKYSATRALMRRTKCMDCGEEKPLTKSRCYECYKIKANEWLRNWHHKNKGKHSEYYKTRLTKTPTRKCVECGKETQQTTFYGVKQFCSRECFSKNWKKRGVRKGSNNPGFRNGMYVDRPAKKDTNTNLHLSACRKYRVNFRKNNDYDFCEYCGTSSSLRFETHHIVYASEAPKHKELHNFKNLIYLCIQCHNNFHSAKYTRNKLVEERGLNELFKRNLILTQKCLSPLSHSPSINVGVEDKDLKQKTT